MRAVHVLSEPLPSTFPPESNQICKGSPGGRIPAHGPQNVFSIPKPQSWRNDLSHLIQKPTIPNPPLPQNRQITFALSNNSFPCLISKLSQENPYIPPSSILGNIIPTSHSPFPVPHLVPHSSSLKTSLPSSLTQGVSQSCHLLIPSVSKIPQKQNLKNNVRDLI